MEGAEHGFATSSGLAATMLIVNTLKTGDHILCCDDVYGGEGWIVWILLSGYYCLDYVIIWILLSGLCNCLDYLIVCILCNFRIEILLIVIAACYNVW